MSRQLINSKSAKLKSVIAILVVLILYKVLMLFFFVNGILQFYNPMSAFNAVPLTHIIDLSFVTFLLVVELFFLIKFRKRNWNRKLLKIFIWVTGFSVLLTFFLSLIAIVALNFFANPVYKQDFFSLFRDWAALINIILFGIGAFFYVVAFKNSINSSKEIEQTLNESADFLDEFSNSNEH